MSADDLLAAIGDWRSEKRIEDAASQRSAHRWNQQLATEELTIKGILGNLASTSCLVQLLVPGRTVAGSIANVGDDYCEITTAVGTNFVSLWAISSIHVDQPWRSIASPAVELDNATKLSELIGALQERRPHVRVATRASTEYQTGELVAVGNGVAIIDQSGRSLVVSISQISELLLVGS